MSKITFVDEEQAKQAIKDVRADTVDTNWCLFSYENAQSQKIALVGKGNGGIEELKDQLKDDIVGYGLIRKTDKIDDSVTVKFAFIFWLGDNVGRMQKARVSVHQGGIREFIGQFHVDISANNKDELTEELLTQKVMDTSGSSSRVLNKETGQREVSSGNATKSGGNVKTSGALQFVPEDELKKALADVRAGQENDWVLVTYEEGNTNNIVLYQKGNGVSDLVGALNDNVVVYGLVRKHEKIDETVAAKFVFIRFTGEGIPRMLKARLGTHSGAVTSFFHPYHVDIDASQSSEISDEIIMQKIKAASGTKVNVLADDRPKSTSTVSTGQRTSSAIKPSSNNTTKSPVVPKTLSDNQTIKFVNKDEVVALIKDVRNDNTDTDWCLVGYENKKGNVVVPLGKGNGGVAELVEHLQDDIVAYALVRKVEQIDDSKTVKFAHIVWVGENIDRMHRARLGTHKGAVTELFHPFHCDINCSNKSEINDDIVMNRIQVTSGTKSHVKN